MNNNEANQLEKASTEIPYEETPPWSPRVIGANGLLFGPIAAALITYFNFKRMGQPNKAKWTIILTIIGTTLFIIFALMSQNRRYDDFMRLLSQFASLLLYPAVQLEDFNKWKLKGRAPYNGWKSLGWGILGVIAFFALTMIVTLVLHTVLVASVLGQTAANDWVSIGNVLTTLGRDNEAVQAFDKAIEIDPKDAMAWYDKGTALYSLNQYNESIQALDKALEINPQFSIAWNNKGLSLESLGKYNESIQAFDKAIEYDPSKSPGWLNKVNALKLLGKTKEWKVAFSHWSSIFFARCPNMV